MSREESFDAPEDDLGEEAVGIAVLAMSCRLPGAANVETFWQNLVGGVESIRFFGDEELRSAGVAESDLARESYVRAAGILDDVESFDAGLFDLTAHEAALMAPEHRLFLECSFEALERAGYGGVGESEASAAPRVGVFGGAGLNTYYLGHVAADPERLRGVSRYQAVLANDKDFLATRVAYKLNLRGPAITLQTACSTSLVAIHLACQSLDLGECDLALAGGATVVLPQVAGYRYREGGIASPDGHCRPFDARAQGTVGSSGAAVVVLKRLADALADGDAIEAVILGSAINNDGSHKVGFTAPSVDGQAAVLSEALEIAGVDAETIGYVEAHGTATPLGDPIEVAALEKAFRDRTDRIGFCALGSVKSNIGHTDTAAGAAGLIKTVLALKHGRIPPSLHFEEPNPRIAFDRGPFRVAGELLDWPEGDAPRRAGVSSFGIGGTNAHAVLEAAPEAEAGSPSRPRQLLVLSAKTPSALETATDRLATFCETAAEARPELDLADVAFTLSRGRRAFPWRRAVVADDFAGAARSLAERDPLTIVTGSADPPEDAAPGAAGGTLEATDTPVAFLFPGQGAQSPGMGEELYHREGVYRDTVDRCAELLEPHLELDLRTLLHPSETERDTAAERLRQTVFAQTALFTVEYALARLWISWGVRPRAMAGHSIGEYVAACLAGVFSLEDALALVAERGRLMQAMPSGAMLHVAAPAAELEGRLGEELSLAAINAPARSVVSGPDAAIEALAAKLEAEGIDHRRLHTSHAFHSAMMDPILERFAAAVGGVERRTPKIPYVSNVTGDWIEADEATNPEYWARHLRQTVLFDAGLERLGEIEGLVLLEVGPGGTLGVLATEHAAAAGAAVRTVASLPSPREAEPALAVLLRGLGSLWVAGVEIDGSGFWSGERRRRVHLPTYPFERQRHWIDPEPASPMVGAAAANAATGSFDDGSVEALIEHQIEILAGQLEILRRGGNLE